MAKGEVNQAEKSFMGMPVSIPRLPQHPTPGHIRAFHFDTGPQFHLNGTARHCPNSATISRDGAGALGDGRGGEGRALIASAVRDTAANIHCRASWSIS